MTTHQSEEALDFLEEQIPSLSASAIRVAFWSALASGSSVLEAREGQLVEVFPDGTWRVVKPLEAGVEVPVGTRLELP